MQASEYQYYMDYFLVPLDKDYVQGMENIRSAIKYWQNEGWDVESLVPIGQIANEYLMSNSKSGDALVCIVFKKPRD